MIVFFPHIPKTGGTSLNHMFYSAFGGERCLKVWDPKFGADVSPDEFPNLPDQKFQNKSAIIGHIPVLKFLENSFTQRKLNNSQINFVTTVRDPISRIISLYNFVYYNKNHPNNKKIQEISLVKFSRNQQANFQFNYLKMKKDFDLDSIFEWMHVFPIEKSTLLLEKYFMRKFNIKVNASGVMNKSSDHAKGQRLFTIDDLSDETLQYLNERHSLDNELFGRAFRKH